MKTGITKDTGENVTGGGSNTPAGVSIGAGHWPSSSLLSLVCTRDHKQKRAEDQPLMELNRNPDPLHPQLFHRKLFIYRTHVFLC